MKVKKEYETDICDHDGCSDLAYNECLKCHSTFCSDHKKVEGIEYPYSLHFGGSYEGFYCNQCVGYLMGELGTENENHLFALYVRMKLLRETYEKISGSFIERGKSLSDKIESIRDITRKQA